VVSHRAAWFCIVIRGDDVKSKAIVIGIAILMIQLMAVTAQGDAGMEWLSEGTSPLAGGYGEGSVATSDYIYILECQDVTSQCYFYKYSVSQGVWRQASTLGLESGVFRNGTALAWNGNDLIYALTGARYSDASRTLFLRFDIEEGRWQRISDTPAAQGAGDAITWCGYDAAIYALIGSGKHNGGVTYFARYSPTSDNWDILDSLWQDTDDGASLTWDGGEYIYALRGEFDETVPNGDFARYSLVAQTWEPLASLPDPNGVGDGASLLSIAAKEPDHGDYIYAVSGGSAAEDPGYGFFRYQISTNTWDEMPSLPCPIGFYVGRRLTYGNGHFYYWQGSPTSSKWLCGGDAFFSMQVTTPSTTTGTEANPPTGATYDDAAQQVATLPDGTLVTLYDDFTWEYYNQGFSYNFDFSTLTSDTIPSFLHQGVNADVATQTIAVEIYLQGWRYVMPIPKSNQAAWGNSDGRTTWWYGYWYNLETGQVSASQPVKKENGLYYGDDQDLRNTWRRGGSPRYPNELEWLLSESGGVPPQS